MNVRGLWLRDEFGKEYQGVVCLHARWIQIFALAGMVVSLVGAGFLSDPIVAQRRQHQFGYDVALSQAKTQTSVATVTSAAMGAFRGVIADILWYRANKLKDEGKFYEANTLAEWITTLQPSFVSVWGFNAWNMAYNISVATYTPAERWDWVNKGIALLRDRGIPMNPRAVGLYKELSYIFFHKVNGVADDMHWYYKRQFAREWQEILGAPRDDASMDELILPLQAVVDAPDQWADFKALNPQAASLLAELAKLGYSSPDEELLRQVGRIQMFRQSVDARIIGIAAKDRPDFYDVRLVDLLNQPLYAGAWEKLIPFLRKQVLVTGYQMDPAFMISLMQMQEKGGYGFGPLDWRHPAVHGLYWGVLGTKIYADVKGYNEIDLLNTYRQAVHSLQALTDAGRVNYDPVSGHIDFLPDPRFIPAYEKAWDLAIKDLLNRDYMGNPKDSYQAGHENFLLKAVVYCYLYGSQEQAQKYYDRVRELYGSRWRSDPGKLLQTLPDLVMGELAENIDIMSFSRQFIDSRIIEGMTRGLANNRPEVFEHSLALARQVHTKFNQQAVAANPNTDQKRMAMLPFDQIVMSTYMGYMQAELTEPEKLLFKSRIWRNTPEVLRHRMEPRLRPVLVQQCGQVGLDPDLAFPSSSISVSPQDVKPPVPGAAEDANAPVRVERK